MIDLKDRLSLVLEPPLETLLAGESLDFPAQPFPFQLAGVAFLYPRCAALLADEMGLGKTMQAITAMRLLFRTGQIRRVLLVCPKPLVTNWRREFQLWAPELPLSAIEGDRRAGVGNGNSARRRSWSPITRLLQPRCRCDRRPGPALRSGRARRVAADQEPQPARRPTQCGPFRADRSWALTGTPVENSSDDLVGIFDFSRPGICRASMKPRRMGRPASDYVLRRTKDKVLTDLPPKDVSRRGVELSAEQREPYQMAEEEGVLRLTDSGRGRDDPARFRAGAAAEADLQFRSGHRAERQARTAARPTWKKWPPAGSKAIVFSQWVRTLEALPQTLAAVSAA